LLKKELHWGRLKFPFDSRVYYSFSHYTQFFFLILCFPTSIPLFYLLNSRHDLIIFFYLVLFHLAAVLSPYTYFYYLLLVFIFFLLFFSICLLLFIVNYCII